MRAHAATAGRRMCLGTWRQLEAYGRWMGGASHGDRSGLVRLGVVLRRTAGSVVVAVFYGALLQRAPGGIYAVPIVWAIGAWQMSDTSAPPPPQPDRPSCRKCAGHEPIGGAPSEPQKGMLIYTVDLPNRPGHTHVHVQQLADEQRA